jgi:NAD-dependent deacetylase
MTDNSRTNGDARERVELLREWIARSRKIVFFGGAGVSTESGIPDFRSVDGLYSQKYAYPPEEILSHSFFMREPEEFYRFYRDKILRSGIEPNAAHVALAELEKAGALSAVVTQNIDGLHQAAGSRNVLELHGSTHRNYCTGCAERYGFEFMLNYDGLVPHCPKCGAIVRPDVVLYEESLDTDTVNAAARHIREADMLIVGGTSLVVYPAAGLIDLYTGDRLILINKSATSRDAAANLLIPDSIGKVLSTAVAGIR